MKVVTEITIIINKGMLPEFVSELYRKHCIVQNLRIVEENKNEELYKIEIIYNDRSTFRELITTVAKTKDKYRILSIVNTLEKNIEGGLMHVCGKLPLENMNDYEMNLVGATDLILEKIDENAGSKYIGIHKSIALVNGIKFEEEINKKFLYKAYARSESDAVLIHRFTGMNAFPLAITFNHVEDFLKTLSRVENSFSLIKINDIDEYDISIYEHLYSELNIPVIFKWLDDIPLCLLAVLNKLMKNNELSVDETNVGFIGLDVGSLRLTRLLTKIGIARVLGNDQNEKLVMDFENHGGLGTTNENIFSNADVIIISKNSFTSEEMQKMRPGQFVVSLVPESGVDMDMINNKGIREYISFNKSHTTAVFPGLIKGILDSGYLRLTNNMLIESAAAIEQVMLDNYTFPDVFSDIHDTIAGIINKDE